MSELFVVLAAVVLLFLGLLAGRIRRNRRLRKNPPLQVRPPLAAVQRAFHRTLRQALPGHVVLAQVPFSSFLTVTQIPAKQAEQLTTELDGHNAEYLICNENLQVVAVAGLDEEPSADRDRLLRAAGVPHVGWRSKSLPSHREIADTIQDLETGPGGPGLGASNGAGRLEPDLGDPDDLGIHDDRQEPRL